MKRDPVTWAICLTILASFHVVIASKRVVWDWKNCYSPDHLIVTHWGVSLDTCAEECDKRPTCLHYNYRKRLTSCELLEWEGHTYTNESGCVSGISIEDLSQCKCYPGDDCNALERNCNKHECEPFHVENAVGYGNVWSEGSKVKFVCESNNNVTTTTCQDNGEWVPFPICPAGCGPLSVENANVSGNDWSVGSKVNIICQSDNTLKYTATCQEDGTWARLPTCRAVASCPSSGQDFVGIGTVSLKVCTESKTKNDAAEACAPYGELARLDNQEQLDELLEYMNIMSGSTGIIEGQFWVQGEFDLSQWTWTFNDGTLLPSAALNQYYKCSGGVFKTCMNVKIAYGKPPQLCAENCFKTFGYICMAKDTLYELTLYPIACF